MPPIPGMMHWHHYLAKNLQAISKAVAKAARTLDAQLAGQPAAKLEPILVRNTPKQPLHPLARIRQSQSQSQRWYSTARKSVDSTVRHFTTASERVGGRLDRASLPKSRVSHSISQSSGRAPFASTLRPNLTGGALGRTAGGYSLGAGRVGGARYFSHGPACQAQVVSNVSQAVRAFFVGGHKAQFDGVCARTGEKRYKPVSALQEQTGRRLRGVPMATPGSYVDFRINPTVTALTPLAALSGFSGSASLQTDNINTDGLLDALSADFSRALKDLAATLSDLKRLSALGNLPITYEAEHLRVHFPGCDAETVERLCTELAVSRGTVVQDEAFDAFAGTEIALLFPFAPSKAVSEEDCDSYFEEAYAQYQPINVQSMFTPAYSTQSAKSSSDFEDIVAYDEPLSYESVASGSVCGSENEDQQSPLEYQGFEGIYRFLEQLDALKT
ncbi:hypothetical protein LTR08_005938 [Meristemomyces frigidus]|nr:hypothetical protein LTR08_005938 [Meristemomyces frigidus]